MSIKRVDVTDILKGDTKLRVHTLMVPYLERDEGSDSAFRVVSTSSGIVQRLSLLSPETQEKLIQKISESFPENGQLLINFEDPGQSGGKREFFCTRLEDDLPYAVIQIE